MSNPDISHPNQDETPEVSPEPSLEETTTNPAPPTPPRQSLFTLEGIVGFALFYSLPLCVVGFLGYRGWGWEGAWAGAGLGCTLFWMAISLNDGSMGPIVAMFICTVVYAFFGFIFEKIGILGSFWQSGGISLTTLSSILLLFSTGNAGNAIDADALRQQRERQKDLLEAQEHMGELAQIAHDKELYVILGHPSAGATHTLQLLHNSLGAPNETTKELSLTLHTRRNKEKAPPTLLYFETSFGRREILLCTFLDTTDPRDWAFLLEHAKGALVWMGWSDPQEPHQPATSSLWDKQKRWFSYKEIQAPLQRHINDNTCLVQSIEPKDTSYTHDERWQQAIEWIPAIQRNTWTRNFSDQPNEEVTAPTLKLLTLTAQKKNQRADKELQQHMDEYESSLFS